MKKLRTAVIGVGYLGKFHAEKYASLPNSELVAVVDANLANGTAIAEKNGCEALTQYQDLYGRVDAVSIAAPTVYHYQIAKDCLEHGIHVLIEKPITVTVAEADELIALAKSKKLLIQVGHLERFNAALLALGDRLGTPRFIESHRLAPFNPRANDVNVVLDLMIHDIDIIQNMVGSPIKSIAASGTKVLTDSTDIANARIEFDSGCVANVTASRVSLKTERKMRIFQEESCITIDFQNRSLKLYSKGEKEMFPGIPEIESEESIFENNDALKVEIIAFLDSIEQGKATQVSGEDGRRALATAQEISRLMQDA
ncbi:Gfo/Idh/MocA family oxidoreductase [Simiduia curdlanivorans]|uniref:Gfo/Idh/MocA family protein n=1 Tax=Simiduia curdlanivorans TaxID=1492769 RepID=A0ABV8V022_9GAMM|nr:Gfo/Idh/MocA family oxidoreductase [Simiduia curdlanivorans]MDN3640377.1 Gfo/Idh/MocA family oxidoreductase [Simiduia curdlanivorans]